MTSRFLQRWLGTMLALGAGWAVFCGGAASAQGPSDFLRRLDTNGNGMLDPEELDGRMGSFIRRMAENNPRIDLSRPIPFDRLSEEFNRMREERMRSGGGPGGGVPPGPGGGVPPGPGGWGGGGPGGGVPPGPGGWGDRGRDSHSHGGPSPGPSSSDSSSSMRTTKVEPLVPGFGTNTKPTPPQAFGGESELFRVQITDEDRREAERAFRYYDRNGDGKIDASEMAQSPRGADLPMYDKNHDGVITLNEMEYRYARRRLDNERENRNAPGGGNDRGGGDRGGRDRGDRARGGGSRDEGHGGSADDKAGDKDSVRKTFRRKSATELLPSGLPDWFAPSDKDADGQVALHEFADPMSDADLAEFNQFDLNGDGLITPQECLRAKQKGAVRGSSAPAAPVAAGPAPPATTAPTPAAAAPAPPGTTASAPVAAAPAPPRTTAPASAAAAPARSGTTAAPAVDPRFLAYCKKLIEKYDTNHDGELTPQEWAKMSKSPAAADTDRNGRITVEEYARWMQQQQ